MRSKKQTPPTELNQIQSAHLRRMLKDAHYTKKSVIENGINQVLAGTWSTERLKNSPEWVALPEEVRLNVSAVLNAWIYKAHGGKGLDCQSMSGRDTTPVWRPSQFKFHL